VTLDLAEGMRVKGKGRGRGEAGRGRRGGKVGCVGREAGRSVRRGFVVNDGMQ
jgi:hypothetical protein